MPAVALEAVVDFAEPDRDMPPPIDTRTLRNAMGQFATGVVVISTQVNGHVHAMTANAFMSGSLEPPLILVSVAHTARMFERIQTSGRFAVSVLADHQQSVSNYFAGKGQGDGVPAFARLDELPVVADAIVQVATHVEHRYPCGDHTLFVGRVTALRQDAKPASPLLFHSGCYQTLMHKSL